MKIVLPAIYRAGRYTIRTSDYPPRVPETIVCLKRLFMRSIKGSLAGLILTGILAIVPAAAFAHGGGGGGGGHGGGGGGHGFGGGFHGGFAGHSSGRAFSMGGHSVIVPHSSRARASGFARALGSHDGPLR